MQVNLERRAPIAYQYKKMIFLKKPYLLALLIAVALAAWLLSGQMAAVETSQEIPIAAPEKASPNIIKVRVREQQAQPLTREIILTGRTAPFRTVTLRAEIIYR